MAPQPKCLLFANTARYLHHYRGGLIRRLVKDGWKVVLVSPPESRAFVDDFEVWGARWRSVRLKPGSTNPVAELISLARLVRIYRDERPDLVHNFTPKGVIYGSVASRLSGVSAVINSVTGLGHVFTDTGIGARLLRPAVRYGYRLVLDGRGHRVIVQNEGDREALEKIGASDPARTMLVRGSGVDLNRFQPKASTRGLSGVFKLLFAARLLREKGLIELIEAVRSIAGDGHSIKLVCAGEIYPENPTSLTAAEMKELRTLTFFDDVGYVDDMPALLETVDAVVLPTYREGASRLIMEAGAMKKPVISTQIPGNKGLVIDGRSGILVPPRDIASLRAAILELMGDRGMCRRFGDAGREIVVREFDEENIIRRTLLAYNEAMSEARSLVSRQA